MNQLLNKLLAFTLIVSVYHFPALAATGEESVCGTTSSCDLLSADIASVLGFFGAAIGPHFLLGLSKPSHDIDSTVQFGFGAKQLKEATLDIRSPFTSTDTWQLTTAGRLQLFDKTIPSNLRYGLGVGFLFQGLDRFQFLPEAGLAVAKYGGVSEMRLAPLVRLTSAYKAGDRDRIFISASAQLFEDAIYRCDLGYAHHFPKSQTSMAADQEFGPVFSYEENRFPGNRLWIVALATEI